MSDSEAQLEAAKSAIADILDWMATGGANCPSYMEVEAEANRLIKSVSFMGFPPFLIRHKPRRGK